VQFRTTWYQDGTVLENAIFSGSSLQGLEVLHEKVRTAAKSQKEKWCQHSIDPIALYFRKVAAKALPRTCGAAQRSIVASLDYYIISYVVTQLEAWEAEYPEAIPSALDVYAEQSVKKLRRHLGAPLESDWAT